MDALKTPLGNAMRMLNTKCVSPINLAKSLVNISLEQSFHLAQDCVSNQDFLRVRAKQSQRVALRGN
jgi:hypothetical protein